jgi:hypothetical protein
MALGEVVRLVLRREVRTGAAGTGLGLVAADAERE